MKAFVNFDMGTYTSSKDIFINYRRAAIAWALKASPKFFNAFEVRFEFARFAKSLIIEISIAILYKYSDLSWKFW